MNNSIYKFSLDIHEPLSQIVINLKQNDTAREFLISLTENGRPYTISENCYAVFTAQKPDGNIIYNDCSIEDNIIHYVITSQSTTAVGEHLCEVRLYGENNELLISPAFILLINPTVYHDGDVIESNNEFSALTKIYTRTNALYKDLRQKVDNGDFNGLSAYEIAVLNGFEGSEVEWLESFKAELITPDHSQNDPTQPDYIKNRLAYYQRKFDDIVPDYTEQRTVEGSFTEDGETSSGPMYILIAPMPENADASEIIDELNGFVIFGDDEDEEIYLDDPEVFTEELKPYVKYDHFDTFSAFTLNGQPYIVAVQEANAVYEKTIVDDDYEYSIKVVFPNPGIYSLIIDSGEDESESPVYIGFRKVMFKTAKKLDVELLPKEALSKSIAVDDYPEENSDNPISSDAVYDLKRDINTALSKKADKINVTSADNGKILAVVGGVITPVNIEQAENEVY